MTKCFCDFVMVAHKLTDVIFLSINAAGEDKHSHLYKIILFWILDKELEVIRGIRGIRGKNMRG